MGRLYPSKRRGISQAISGCDRGCFLKLARIFGFSKGMPDVTHYLFFVYWQRRMGVEPTRGRAERPPSRFEDGETHRGPYTSMFARMGMDCIWIRRASLLCHSWLFLSSEGAHALDIYLCQAFNH